MSLRAIKIETKPFQVVTMIILANILENKCNEEDEHF